jgi:methylenetetrahydrofolate reductase (NADPH)
MRVADILADSDHKSFSVEVLPPVTGTKVNELYEFLDAVVQRGIRFVNITHHAGERARYAESNNHQFLALRGKRLGAVGIAGAIQSRYGSAGIEAVPHIICTGFSRYEVEEYLVDLAYLRIRNVLAMIGDAPSKRPDVERIPLLAYPHASGLIEQIVNLRKGLYLTAGKGNPIDFCIGTTCYPEGHPERRQSFPSLEEAVEDEVRWCKVKVDAGAEYLVTQMFFDNRVYKHFTERAKRARIDAPILPGIRPVTNWMQFNAFLSRFGASVPQELRDRMKGCQGDKETMEEIGIRWCIEQCTDLLHYAPGIHLFATSKKRITSDTHPMEEILERIV